jgi:hypothetical protein
MKSSVPTPRTEELPLEATELRAEPPHVGVSAATATATAPRGQYELTESENALLADLAEKMYFVGWFTLSVGIFVVLLGVCMLNTGSVLSGTLYAVMGLWTHRASLSFKSTAQGQGSDLSSLFEGLADLRNLYSIHFWICSLTLAIVFMVLAVLALRG